MRDAHLDDTPLRPSAQRRAGLWARAPQPREEHHAVGKHVLLGHGQGDDCGGSYHEGCLRDLHRTSIGALAFGRAGSRIGQPRRAQGRAGARTDRDRGCSLLFLPPYSPDFSPIEEAFSKVKVLLKKTAASTREALVEAIGRALGEVTARDAAGWFAHCGYWPSAQPS
jgi:DDE superfamily endonuclease